MEKGGLETASCTAVNPSKWIRFICYLVQELWSQYKTEVGVHFHVDRIFGTDQEVRILGMWIISILLAFW